MNLLSIRNKLNNIDTKIVRLIAKRQSYMPAVGAYKKKHGLAINQKDRELAIIEALKKMSVEEGVSQALVESIFKLIFKDSKKIQKEV